MRFLFLLLLCAVHVQAQTVNVFGGSSTLMEGTGAGITAFLPDSTVSISGGLAQGHIVFGAKDTYDWRGYTWAAGSQQFGGSIDGAGTGLQGIGLSLAKRRPNNSRIIGAFIGTEGLGIQLPYFSGATPQHFGAAVYVQQRVGRFRLGGIAALSAGAKTSMASVMYQHANQHSNLQASFAAGLLQNNKSVNGSLAYAPINFVRINASQQNSFGIPYGSHLPLNMLTDTAGLSAGGRILTASASVTHGKANGITSNGESFGAQSAFSIFNLTANYFTSHSAEYTTHFETLGVSERLGQHLRATETLAKSGNTSLEFGGEYTSNRFSVSLDHSTAFVPFSGRGYIQVTAITASVRVHDALLTLGNVITQTGQMKWTVYGNDWTRGPLNMQANTSGTGHSFHTSSGKYVVQGVIRDAKTGKVVEGAAVQIGKQLVFSNRSGIVFTRTKKNIAVTVRVSPEDFTAQGHWQVVSAPATVTPLLEGHAEPFVITVEIF